ncbi:MAG: hypothetical protein ACJAYR_001178 [Sneathiella sp.]|jgi:hypothetical protein
MHQEIGRLFKNFGIAGQNGSPISTIGFLEVFNIW